MAATKGYTIKDVPWSDVAGIIALIRRWRYTKDWPEDVPSTVVAMPASEIEDRLRRHHRFEGAPYSYRYEGEVLNLRRPAGLGEEDHQMELHVRGRAAPNLRGTEIVAHTERSRYEHKDDHLDTLELDWVDGLRRFERIEIA